MSKFKIENLSVSGFEGSGLKLEAREESGDDAAYGIVCIGYSEVELNGNVRLSNSGLHGLHVGADVAAIVNGELGVSNNLGHGILIESDFNSLRDDIARMNALLNSPALENFRDDLGSILAEINQELEQSRPNASEILSLLFAAKIFLSGVTERVVASLELINLHTIVYHRVELARQDLNL